MFPLIALLFFNGQTPDLASMKEMAARLREMTAAELDHYQMASSTHLVLVNWFRDGLRTWIESQLPPTNATNEDCARKSADLKALLRNAGVFASDAESEHHSIKLSRPPDYPETLLLRIDIHMSLEWMEQCIFTCRDPAVGRGSSPPNGNRTRLPTP